jgi:hypothetical protein
MMQPKIAERIMASVDKSGGVVACWPWMKSLRAKGYGQTWDGKNVVRAHRVVFELTHDVKLTPEQHVLHAYDNRKCCNPGHLFVGSNLDNVNDKLKKGRQPLGSGVSTSKLTEAQVRDIRENHSGELRRVTAEKFGVTPQAVSHILCGTRWSHI